MSRARIRKYNLGVDFIKSLAKDKLIVAKVIQNGYSVLVARWGVNKKTLSKEAKKYE